MAHELYATCRKMRSAAIRHELLKRAVDTMQPRRRKHFEAKLLKPLADEITQCGPHPCDVRRGGFAGRHGMTLAEEIDALHSWLAIQPRHAARRTRPRGRWCTPARVGTGCETDAFAQAVRL
jgi:hypothetical protein